MGRMKSVLEGTFHMCSEIVRTYGGVINRRLEKNVYKCNWTDDKCTQHVRKKKRVEDNNW